MKKLGLIKVMCLCMFALFGIIGTGNIAQGAVKDGDTGNYKGFKYEIEVYHGQKSATLSAYTGRKTTVVTPKKIRGCRVTSISSSVFAGNYRIKKLVISEGVESVGNMAFYDMQGLRSVSLPQTIKKLDKKCGLNYYSEASDFPKKTYTVVKGSAAFKLVTRSYSSSKIKVKPQKTVVTYFEVGKIGEKNVATRTYKKGKKYGKLPSTSQRGYQFLGWYTKESGGKKVTNKSKATKNQTLYAHWKLISKRAILDNPRYEVDDGEKGYEWDTIYLGKYPTDEYKDDTQRLEWRVLSINGNEALVMTKEAVDAVEYMGRKYESFVALGYKLAPACTWETSDLRKWLNETKSGTEYHWDGFYNMAFSEAEKSMILTSTVTNSGATGNTTQDKVYILSQSEYSNPAYCLTKDEELADDAGTEFANKYKNLWSDYASDYLWLRDMQDETHAFVLDSNNKVQVVPTFGADGTEAEMAKPDEEIPYIRPVMKVDLSNESLWDVGRGYWADVR